MPRQNPLVIRKTFRTFTAPELQALQSVRFNVLRRTLRDMSQIAKKTAAIPSSPFAKGVDSGKLVASIKIAIGDTAITTASGEALPAKYGYSAKRRSYAGLLFVDESMTKAEGLRRSYALIQELGVPGMIRPKNAAALMWIATYVRKQHLRNFAGGRVTRTWRWEHGKPYRGQNVHPHLLFKQRTSKGRGKQRRYTETTAYKFFAEEVRGSKAKGFMKAARNNKTILANFKHDIAAVNIEMLQRVVKKIG